MKLKLTAIAVALLSACSNYGGYGSTGYGGYTNPGYTNYGYGGYTGYTGYGAYGVPAYSGYGTNAAGYSGPTGYTGYYNARCTALGLNPGSVGWQSCVRQQNYVDDARYYRLMNTGRNLMLYDRWAQFDSADCYRTGWWGNCAAAF